MTVYILKKRRIHIQKRCIYAQKKITTLYIHNRDNDCIYTQKGGKRRLYTQKRHIYTQKKTMTLFFCNRENDSIYTQKRRIYTQKRQQL